MNYAKKINTNTEDLVKHYYECEVLMKEVKRIQFIKLSRNFFIRHFYFFIIDLANNLYNSYMSIVR